MPCKHTSVRLAVETTRIEEYAVNPRGATVFTDPAHTIRLTAICFDCKHMGVYHAYADPANGRGAVGWPTWLLERVRVACDHDDTLRFDCIACHVPGITNDMKGELP